MSGLAKRPPRRFPAPPPEFRQEFERGGWERVELLYGARTDCIRKWIHQTGAQTRRALRAASNGTDGGNAIPNC
jgi:hypothetical protein